MNYGKYAVAVRLLLLKQFLEANAGKNRVVKRSEMEAFLLDRGISAEKKTLYAGSLPYSQGCIPRTRPQKSFPWGSTLFFFS